MSKIESQHLRRSAYVYVRQSTMAQVERNVESRERQYELVDRAVAFGWRAGEVVVIDEDQGRSGKSTVGRDGFQGGAERPRSVGSCSGSRSAAGAQHAAWYQLLDLVLVPDTLIADSEASTTPLCQRPARARVKGRLALSSCTCSRAAARGSLHRLASELGLPLPAGWSTTRSCGSGSPRRASRGDRDGGSRTS